MKRNTMIVLLLVAVIPIFSASGCFILEEHGPFECKLIELRKNPSSQYYDAVVRVDWLTLNDAFKSRFSLVTPTQSHEMRELKFIEDGRRDTEIENDDVFIVPLNRPDWKFFIRERNDIYSLVNFWEMLPENDRWHPLKSEAMTVAEGIELKDVNGTYKPIPGLLPEGWKLSEDRPISTGYRYGELNYSKMKGRNIKEEVDIRYYKLTGEEIEELTTISKTEFLSDWSEWTRKMSYPGVTAGHDSVCWDMKGIGPYGWSYRFMYIDTDMLIETTVNSDPLEWVRKEKERQVIQ